QFLPDGKTFISASTDAIHWRDIVTGKINRRLSGKFSNRFDVRVSPNGKRFAALLEGGALLLGNADTAEEVARIRLGPNTDKRQPSICACFSPDNRTLVYSGGVWEQISTFETAFVATDTGQELRRWGKGVRVGATAFAPDGKSVAQAFVAIDIRDATT